MSSVAAPTGGRKLAVVLACLWLAACASAPVQQGTPATDPVKARAVEVALQMEGQPYRWGGESPSGFDCSGLVQYAYEQAGVSVPRTTRLLYHNVRRQYLDRLEPGDLIFFSLKSARPSHVGIYIGDGRFIHALNPDYPVRIDDISDSYWSRHIVRAGAPRI